MTAKHEDSNLDSVESRLGWLVVIASVIYGSMAFGSSHLIVVSLKPIASEFDWPRWIPSLAYSSIVFGSGLGGILMATIADRFGLKWIMISGPICMALGLISASYANGAVSLLISCAIFIGFLGTGTAFAPLMSNATRWFDRRRGIAVAIVASGQSVSGAIFPRFFSQGIESDGWRDTWFWYGWLGLLIMMPMVLVLKNPPPIQTSSGSAAKQHRQSTDGRWSKGVKLSLLCIAIVGCCVAMAMPMVHIVAYCSDLGFAAVRGAEMLSLLLACAFVSRLAFGVLSDRVGGLWTIFIGAGLQAMALAAYGVIDSLSGLYALSAIYGLVFGGIVPAYAIAIREQFPAADAGLKMGIVFFFGTVGMAAGGGLGGLIFDLTQLYPLAFLVGVIFNIVNLIAITALLWNGRERAPQATTACVESAQSSA